MLIFGPNNSAVRGVLWAYRDDGSVRGGAQRLYYLPAWAKSAFSFLFSSIFQSRCVCLFGPVYRPIYRRFLCHHSCRAAIASRRGHQTKRGCKFARQPSSVVIFPHLLSRQVRALFWQDKNQNNVNNSIVREPKSGLVVSPAYFPLRDLLPA